MFELQIFYEDASKYCKLVGKKHATIEVESYEKAIEAVENFNPKWEVTSWYLKEKKSCKP